MQEHADDNTFFSYGLMSVVVMQSGAVAVACDGVLLFPLVFIPSHPPLSYIISALVDKTSQVRKGEKYAVNPTTVVPSHESMNCATPSRPRLSRGLSSVGGSGVSSFGCR